MKLKKSSERIWMEDENGREIAFVSFPPESMKTVLVDHTVVDQSMNGQGIAAKLMEELVKELQESDRKAHLSCSYAVKWFSRHPEYSDLLDDAE